MGIEEYEKISREHIERVVREAVLKEREICAQVALWRANLYDDIGQKNACKEIYSSILCRSDS